MDYLYFIFFLILAITIYHIIVRKTELVWYSPEDEPKEHSIVLVCIDGSGYNYYEICLYDAKCKTFNAYTTAYKAEELLRWCYTRELDRTFFNS